MNKFILVACILLCSFVYKSIQDKDKTIKPWPKDGKCSAFDIKFAKEGTYKHPTLFVYPYQSRGGKLARIIQSSTGIFVGRADKVGNPERSAAANLHGYSRAPDDGTTIAQIVPIDKKVKDNLYQNKVLVYSNPIKGFLERKVAGKNIDYLRYMTFAEPTKAKEVNQHLKRNIRSWVQNMKDLIKDSNGDTKILTMQYNSLIRNPQKNMKTILALMNVDSSQDRVDCAIADFQKDVRKEQQLKFVGVRGTRAEKFRKAQWEKAAPMLKPAYKMLKDGTAEINQLLEEYGRARNENVDDMKIYFRSDMSKTWGVKK